MDACIALSINLMIVHLYKPQQVYSTSVSLLVEQCKQTEPKKQFLKHRPDVGKGICWSLRAISSFI